MGIREHVHISGPLRELEYAYERVERQVRPGWLRELHVCLLRDDTSSPAFRRLAASAGVTTEAR